MKKQRSYNSRVLTNYILICVFLVAVSFVSFIWNEWVVPVGVGICSILGVVLMVTLLKSNTGDEVSDKGAKGKFGIFVVLRYIIMALGLVACGLLVKFTMDVPVDKTRYFIVIASALPYFGTSIALLITKQPSQVNQEDKN